MPPGRTAEFGNCVSTPVRASIEKPAIVKGARTAYRKRPLGLMTTLVACARIGVVLALCRIPVLRSIANEQIPSLSRVGMGKHGAYKKLLSGLTPKLPETGAVAPGTGLRVPVFGSTVYALIV